MSGKINASKLVKNIARRTKTTGLSTLKWGNKAQEALKVHGFGQVRAKKIATGLRSGTARLTKKESVKVIQALKKGKALKGQMRDISGEVSRFIKTEKQSPEADLRQQRAARTERRIRLRERADETKKEMEKARRADSAQESTTKQSNKSTSLAISYEAGGEVAKMASPAVSSGEAWETSVPKAAGSTVALEPPVDQEIESLVKEAEEHDLPID